MIPRIGLRHGSLPAALVLAILLPTDICAQQNGNGNNGNLNNGGGGVMQLVQALIARVTQLEASDGSMVAEIEALMARVDQLAAAVEKESAKTAAQLAQVLERLASAEDGLNSKIASESAARQS